MQDENAKLLNRELLSQIAALRTFVEKRSRDATLELTANVEFELRGPDGELKERYAGPNLICTAGKNRLLDAGSPNVVNDFKYIALGTSSTAALVADTALGTEIARGSGTTSNPTASSWKTSYVFGAGVGTGTITESALDLASSPSGTILARQVFTGVVKAAGDSLTVSWTIT